MSNMTYRPSSAASALRLATAVLVISCFLPHVLGFTLTPSCRHERHSFSTTTTRYAAVHDIGSDDSSSLTRSQFLTSCLTAAGATLLVPGIALADETHQIVECKVVGGGKPTNCISTSSIKQVDCYAPPWTFEVSPGEAMARLKGVVATDPTLELVEEDGDVYLKVRATRNLVTDELEFVLNANDKVVTFRSAEEKDAAVSDFGANRSRLESIRKKAGIFGVMGEGLTADSYQGPRGNGPLGQLKAFYGLQSGQGFEDVFED